MSDQGDFAAPDPTTQMPVTAAGTGDAGAEEAKPWYKRPGPLAAAGLGGVLILLLLGFLASGLFDEDDPSTVTILRIQRTDDQGNVIDKEITATVTGQDGSATSFLWLRPSNARAPEAAVAGTGGGRAEFQWGPTNDVAEPTVWQSRVVLTETFAPEERLSRTEYDCPYERRGVPTSTTRLVVEFEVPVDPTAPRIATYTFPDFLFLAGDVMECEIGSGPPVATTTSTTTTEVIETTTTTTTVPDTTSTTTTVPDTTTTTVAETTTTAAATTTAAETTTTPPTTAPPVTDSLMTVIDGRTDLSSLTALIDLAGLREDLSNPTSTLTLFAPNNDAIAAAAAEPDAPDFTDPATVRDILLAHLVTNGALPAADVLALPAVDVAFGGPQPVDAAASPPTVGGAGIIEPDVGAGNSILHVVNAVITPV
jgi:uncharacterized surface protein with fasciclin (FAS1) repeats